MYDQINLFGGVEGQWRIRLERVQEFFTANDVPENKRRSSFLTSCGYAAHILLRDLMKPHTSEEKALKQIFHVPGKYYSPEPSQVVQRSWLNTRTRRECESVSDFFAFYRYFRRLMF